ncbi:MAG TPA: GAF domain-containing protein, partial [Paracoccaceae bacterium]|nr:GAF domain-containing protein [Paracoccaceae bacterium]
LQVAAYVGQYRDALMETFPAPWEITPAGESIRTRKVTNYADVQNDPATPRVLQRVAKVAGYHSVAFAPMIWEGKGIGVVGVARSRRPFNQKELRIMQGFADQAVIAIQNARMFKETSDALERQTATAEVLEVISNSVEDTQPVFEKILESCKRLIPSTSLSVLTVDDNLLVHMDAVKGVVGKKAAQAYQPTRLENTIIADALKSGRVMHHPDAANGKDVPEVIRMMARKTVNFSALIAPMIWKGQSVGGLFLTRKIGDDDWRPFNKKDISLLQSFADQAVIAIQNARLFNETQASLARQTASADILRVISRSPTDVTPVFEEIVQSAIDLVSCDSALVIETDEKELWNAAHATAQGLSTDFPR